MIKPKAVPRPEFASTGRTTALRRFAQAFLEEDADRVADELRALRVD